MAERKTHSYKIKDPFYSKAVKRAKKEKGTLANVIELVVMCYAEGMDIQAVSSKDGACIKASDIINLGLFDKPSKSRQNNK